MKRICKECFIEKDIILFVKGIGKLYRYKCKECANKKRRTGTVNLGRFQKGHSLGKRFQKGSISWSKLNKGTYQAKRSSESRNSAKYKDWRYNVKQRDGFKCIICSNSYRISAHHIKKWKDFPDLRFDVNNGLTLCNICHAKEEGFKKGHIANLSEEARKKISESNRGRKLTQQHKEKLRSYRIGKPGPNTGRKFSEEHRKKLSDAKKGKPGLRTGIKSKNLSPLKGIKLSEAHRKKLSEAAKNRCQLQQMTSTYPYQA